MAAAETISVTCFGLALKAAGCSATVLACFIGLGLVIVCIGGVFVAWKWGWPNKGNFLNPH